MLVTTTLKMPDGKSYELTLEPMFGHGRDLRDVKCHMIVKLADRDPAQEQSTLGGEIDESERALRLVDQ